jgi:hypothetical protein
VSVKELGLENWFRRKTMSQLKSIIFTALFCMLCCTTELYALGPGESNLEKKETTFSLDFIAKPLDGVINGLAESLDGTINDLAKSLDGTINGIGESLDGTMKGLAESLDGTMTGLGYFLEDTCEVAGEVAKVAIVVGVVFLYITAEANFYYHYGHNHCYH